MSLAAAAGLGLRGDLTWADAEDRSDGRVTEHVLNVPEWLVNVGLRSRLSWIPARLDVHGAPMDTVFTSLPWPRYPDDPVREVGSCVLTDARFGFDVTPKVELWRAVRNLFDVGYESEPAYPGPGRALSVGLSARS